MDIDAMAKQVSKMQSQIDALQATVDGLATKPEHPAREHPARDREESRPAGAKHEHQKKGKGE